MGVRGTGAYSALAALLGSHSRSALAAQRLAEIRGLPPLEFAKRGVVEHPVSGTSALITQVSKTHTTDLGGGVVQMTEQLCEAQANAKITVIGMDAVSELFRIQRR